MPCRVTRPAAWFSAPRAVLVWVVLAGLFFMHGAASPGGGCQGGTPVTAIGMPLMPGGAAASAVPDTGPLAVVRTPAGAAAALVARHPASPAVPRAAVPVGDSCCGAMLCSSRQPRQTHAGALVIPALVATASTVVPVLPGAAAVTGQPRPPGRPGLPLPLFLGVSRR